jgi:hypothetical protein
LVVERLHRIGAALEQSVDRLVSGRSAPLELRGRLQPAGPSRVADNEDGIPVLDASLAPLEPELGLNRVSSLVVDAVEREIEVVTREGEVIVVSAEETDLQLISTTIPASSPPCSAAIRCDSSSSIACSACARCASAVPSTAACTSAVTSWMAMSWSMERLVSRSSPSELA